MKAQDYLKKHHPYITQIGENYFEYSDSSVAAISCEHEGDTVTMPANHQNFDWLFIVKSIDNDTKREMFFVKVDDITGYLRPSVIGSYPFIGKRSLTTLKKNRQTYDSLKGVVRVKEAVKPRSTAQSIF